MQIELKEITRTNFTTVSSDYLGVNIDRCVIPIKIGDDSWIGIGSTHAMPEVIKNRYRELISPSHLIPNVAIVEFRLWSDLANAIIGKTYGRDEDGLEYYKILDMPIRQLVVVRRRNIEQGGNAAHMLTDLTLELERRGLIKDANDRREVLLFGENPSKVERSRKEMGLLKEIVNERSARIMAACS